MSGLSTSTWHHVLTYGAYDRTGESGQPDPIIDTRWHLEVGDWTDLTDGRWTAALAATNTITRFWINDVGQPKADDAASC